MASDKRRSYRDRTADDALAKIGNDNMLAEEMRRKAAIRLALETRRRSQSPEASVGEE